MRLKADEGQVSRRTVVSSWNEWDPLRHVIVGVAAGTQIQAPEPAVQRNWPEYGFPYGAYGPFPPAMEEKAVELVEGLAQVLESRGIRVDRPVPVDFGQATQTPDWKQGSMFGCMAARDLLLTVGHEILEATMSSRARWFEYLCYRPLLERYFREDPGFRWEAAPKPRLTARSYVRDDFWLAIETMSEEEQIERFTMRRQWLLSEEEPLFDAADVGRFGKDLFVQRSVTTNGAAVEWLRRHFPDHRVHEVLFREGSPTHIDATFLPLRPGLALINRTRPPLDAQLVELFARNGWEMVECAPAAHEHKVPLSPSSVWLSMNVLMLDPKTVCVEAGEVWQMEQLDRLGFEVIPVPFREAAPFGGGLHCSTADVFREGSLEDYFPRQVAGF